MLLIPYSLQFCAAQGVDSEGSDDEEEVDDVLALATVINLTLHKVLQCSYSNFSLCYSML